MQEARQRDRTGLTQRKIPKMALINTRVENDTLHIKLPKHHEIKINQGKQQHWQDVIIWKDQVQAIKVDS